MTTCAWMGVGVQFAWMTRWTGFEHRAWLGLVVIQVTVELLRALCLDYSIVWRIYGHGALWGRTYFFTTQKGEVDHIFGLTRIWILGPHSSSRGEIPWNSLIKTCIEVLPYQARRYNDLLAG